MGQKIPQDIIGDIAILKLPFNMKEKEKKKIAEKFLKTHKNISTVLEKTGKFSGRLRKPETKFLAGEKKKETVHVESGCKFFLDVDETYFSPRLAEHRKNVLEKIARKLKSGSKVLVMFAGVAPWPIVLAKILKTKYPKKEIEIISNEINRKANMFAEKNIKLNKLRTYVKIVSGDAKKLPGKLKGYKADIILMPRPNLKQTFLSSALKLGKKGTFVYYHGFGKNKQDIIDEIKTNIGKNKISKIKIRKAGEIAPYTFRWIVRFEVL